MGKLFRGYLQLCRPANLPTAAADVLAGLAIAGWFASSDFLWDPNLVFPVEGILLVVASVLLYAGGVVMNDVFDVEIDTLERPERPIPSGVVPLKNAALFGCLLLLLGFLMALQVNQYTGIVAAILVLAILVYDKFAKHHGFFGPLNMGICRGLNLLLGIAFVQQWEHWMYCVVPVLFVFAITMISQGEVHGNNRRSIALAGFLYVFVIFYVSILNQKTTMPLVYQLPFFLLFAIMVLLPLIRAYRANTPLNIKKAVKAGVISIVILDAMMAIAHTNLIYALAILLLLPLAMGLAKLFAVT